MVTKFDRETLLDFVVNLVPLSILAVFVVVFALFNSFGWDPIYSTLQFSIILGSLVGLVVITYYTGKAIYGAEREGETADHGGSIDD